MKLRTYAAGMLAFALLGFVFGPQAHADTATESGTFSADNSVYTYDITVSGTQNYTFYTTSYATGGFVPYLTLFSTSGANSGMPLGFDGADGMCSGSMTADATTGMCDDAFLQETLSPGTYTLDLTEFPNVANGNLSDGFLFAGDATATGDVCGVSGGMFLQADVAPCVQRTDAYSLTITSASPTPEPSTFLLGLPVAAFILLSARRRLV
jgi:hypothetical protein